MDKEKTKDLIKIMQAFLEGETIECKLKILEDVPGNWLPYRMNNWNTSTYTYRIKPKPQYRPFKDRDECYQEMLKHQPFGWVKIGEDYESIVELDSINERIMFGNNYYYGWKTAVECITFLDGTPFGIKLSDNLSLESKK